MYQNNEREEASLGKVAYEEARVDLSDITVPVGKCKQRAEITMSHGMWGMTRLKLSIESVEERARVGPAVPSEVLETAERCLRDFSLVRSCKSEIKF
jgi:hypothetical protein